MESKLRFSHMHLVHFVFASVMAPLIIFFCYIYMRYPNGILAVLLSAALAGASYAYLVKTAGAGEHYNLKFAVKYGWYFLFGWLGFMILADLLHALIESGFGVALLIKPVFLVAFFAGKLYLDQAGVLSDISHKKDPVKELEEQAVENSVDVFKKYPGLHPLPDYHEKGRMMSLYEHAHSGSMKQANRERQIKTDAMAGYAAKRLLYNRESNRWHLFVDPDYHKKIELIPLDHQRTLLNIEQYVKKFAASIGVRQMQEQPQPFSPYSRPNYDGFSSIYDIKRALDYGNKNPAHWIQVGGGFMWNKQGHCTTFGAARGNKGTDIVIPSLTHDDLRIYDNAPSFVVLDPKGENLAISHDYLVNCGYDVQVICPFDIKAIRHIRKRSHWNPFELFPLGHPDFNQFIDLLGFTLIPPSNHQNSFWENAARRYITLYARHMMTQEREPKNIHTLYKWLLMKEKDRTKLWLTMEQNPAFGSDISIEAKGLRSQYENGTDKQIEDIFGNVRNAIDVFKDEDLRNSLMKSDFDMRTIAQNKTAIFICLEPADLQRCAVWLRLLFNSVIRVLNKHFSKDRRVILLMDEFVQMGYLQQFESMSEVMAGYNVTLWPICQNLPQLKALYPHTWETFVGNSVIRHFTKVSDLTTAKYLEEHMPQVNRAPMGVKEPRWERLRTASQIMSGQEAYWLISGMEGVALLPRNPYYKNTETRGNAAENPYYKS